ncbi:methyl-directed repair DNA adenine methylase [Klebsiella pneumoniae]|nr:methyl-directed repair DNA adenine methylase [Klebsiella pneumoniae]
MVYCDPPYAPLTATANFTAYHTNSFNLEQQVLLAQKAESLMKKRIPVLISNHRTPLTQEWYKKRGRNAYCEGAAQHQQQRWYA